MDPLYYACSEISLFFFSSYARNFTRFVYALAAIMDIDELSYNVFYLLLRNEFRKKYDLALTKCWTICVPCGGSLKDISITKEFVDDHVLKPLPVDLNAQFASTDDGESHLYNINNGMIQLIDDNELSDDYKVKILSIEKGYNKEFQSYTIIIVDKPLHRKYRIFGKLSESDKLQLNRSVSSYNEALLFLKELSKEKSYSLNNLITEVKSINMKNFDCTEDLKNMLHQLIRDHWAIIIRKQIFDIQRDARFQKLLSLSLEIFVMHQLHENLYTFLSNKFGQEDTMIKKKIDQLIEVGVTPDQLGATESLSVSMPSAIVELATLESHTGPFEKLMCLKSTLDFIVAEIKGAMADMECRADHHDNSDCVKMSALDTDELIPLLLYVIIKCRTQRLYTDLYYIEKFIWSVSPHDGLSYTLVTFKAALSLLKQISVNELPKRSSKVKTELKISDLLQVAQTTEIKTPLDRQIKGLATMLEQCTQTQ